MYHGQALRAQGLLQQPGDRPVVIYKGTNDKSQVEDVRLEEGLIVHYMFMPYFGAHGYLDTALLDRDFDGMFCFSDQQIFLPHVVRFCRANGIVFVPYIGTTYSLYVNTLRGDVMNFLFAHTTLPLYRKMPVLAKTDAAKKELEALRVPAENITVSPVGIDASVLKKDFLSADRAALRREYGFASDDVILLNVARLDHDKRTLDLLKLFHVVRGKKKFRLLIVGEGELRGAVDEKIAEYAVVSNSTGQKETSPRRMADLELKETAATLTKGSRQVRLNSRITSIRIT